MTGCVDLAFSPSTKLPPIRRLRLDVGQEPKVRAAWLRFPSFTFDLFEQLYRRIATAGYRERDRGWNTRCRAGSELPEILAD